MVEANIDGRALSTISKSELRCLAREGGLDKTSRRRLYAAIEDLKSGAASADGEWIALNGGEDDERDVSPCVTKTWAFSFYCDDDDVDDDEIQSE